MLSWRLWKTIVEPVVRNPIFSRVREERILRLKPRERITIPTYVYIIVAVFLAIFVARTPEYFIVVLQIPMVLIVLLTVSPLAAPLFVVFAGSHLVSQITSDISKEKRQYTYELLCASPAGTLDTNWRIATGILHRGSWFNWLKSITRLALRIAQVTLGALAVITFIALFSGDTNTRLESLRTLTNLILIVGLYYMSMVQPIVASLVVGLHATSLNLSRRDSNIIGLMIYLLIQLMPYVIALLLFVVLNTIFTGVSPLIQVIIDVVVLGSILVVRELTIYFLWWQLKRQLNSTTDYTILSSQIASAHS